MYCSETPVNIVQCSDSGSEYNEKLREFINDLWSGSGWDKLFRETWNSDIVYKRQKPENGIVIIYGEYMEAEVSDLYSRNKKKLEVKFKIF